MVEKELIETDLAQYHQENPPELYTPIFLPGENWRCYVFGECFSLVAYEGLPDGWVIIKSIQDDDGSYWLGNKGLVLAAGWVKSIEKVSTVMREWLDANCNPGYLTGYEGIPGFECSYKGLKKNGK